MIDKTFYNKKTRFPVAWGLVFSFLLLSCSENKKEDRSIAIQWNEYKAESILIPRDLLPADTEDSIKQLLHIQLANTDVPILGEYTITNDAVEFRPVIAFTRGLKYDVNWAGKLITQVEIPPGHLQDAPVVISIYPKSNSLPVNLLKIYIEFSQPMQEGQALKNILVIKNGQDTIPSIFLDLEQELWNKERTVLTLWLDPGRIKRDLQPNKTMGAPLEQGSSYQIVIKPDWPDEDGALLRGEYRKEFVAGMRDSLSPDPGRWTIYSPKAGSNESMKIDLHESLDYILLVNAVRITNEKGNVINGFFGTSEAETILHFTPSVVWKPGNYDIEIEPRLEDLAGNNLERLFDKDLTQPGTDRQKEIFKRSFHIQ